MDSGVVIISMNLSIFDILKPVIVYNLHLANNSLFNCLILQPQCVITKISFNLLTPHNYVR